MSDEPTTTTTTDAPAKPKRARSNASTRKAKLRTAFMASTNAQRAADAIGMNGKTFRGIARSLGFGPQKFGTAWDDKAKRALWESKRVVAHVETRTK